MGKFASRKSGLAACLGLCGLIGLGAPAFAGCEPGTVELRTESGSVVRFSVEIADEEGERAQGLMNREKLASSAGMLFAYDSPRHVTFWMKNTLIPLDMIFADASGVVIRVHEGAVPLDETSIDGGAGISYVLEINGGLAGRLGLTPGAMMRSPAIEQGAAAWTCAEG